MSGVRAIRIGSCALLAEDVSSSAVAARRRVRRKRVIGRSLNGDEINGRIAPVCMAGAVLKRRRLSGRASTQSLHNISLYQNRPRLQKGTPRITLQQPFAGPWTVRGNIRRATTN